VISRPSLQPALVSATPPSRRGSRSPSRIVVLVSPLLLEQPPLAVDVRSAYRTPRAPAGGARPPSPRRPPTPWRGPPPLVDRHPVLGAPRRRCRLPHWTGLRMRPHLGADPAGAIIAAATPSLESVAKSHAVVARVDGSPQALGEKGRRPRVLGRERGPCPWPALRARIALRDGRTASTRGSQLGKRRRWGPVPEASSGAGGGLERCLFRPRNSAAPGKIRLAKKNKGKIDARTVTCSRGSFAARAGRPAGDISAGLPSSWRARFGAPRSGTRGVR